MVNAWIEHYKKWQSENKSFMEKHSILEWPKEARKSFKPSSDKIKPVRSIKKHIGKKKLRPRSSKHKLRSKRRLASKHKHKLRSKSRSGSKHKHKLRSKRRSGSKHVKRTKAKSKLKRQL